MIKQCGQLMNLIILKLNIELKFTNHFKPMYGITVHKAQGMTIDKPYSIYEYDRMAHDMLYVSSTKTQKKNMLISVKLIYLNHTQDIFTDILIMVNHIQVLLMILKKEKKHIKQITQINLEEQ